MGKPVLHLKTPFAVEGLLPRCLGVEAYNGLLLDKWFVAASTNRFCFKMLQPGVEGFALPSQQRPLTDPRQILRNVRVGLAWTRISFWIEHGCSESGLSASELAYAMQGAIVWRLFWSSSTYTKFCQVADEIPHIEKNTCLHIHWSHIRVPHSTQQYSPGAVCRQPTASLLSRRRISNLLCKSFKIVGHAISFTKHHLQFNLKELEESLVFHLQPAFERSRPNSFFAMDIALNLMQFGPMHVEMYAIFPLDLTGFFSGTALNPVFGDLEQSGAWALETLLRLA